MSHICQPVTLMTLLDSGGRCNQTDIARALLSHDQSQIEYYTRITKNMVGRVVRKHGIVERDRATKTYSLVDCDDLTPEQVQMLVKLCERKLEAFLESRGRRIFDHRRKSAGAISGTVRHDVFKRRRRSGVVRFRSPRSPLLPWRPRLGPIGKTRKVRSAGMGMTYDRVSATIGRRAGARRPMARRAKR